MKLVTKMPGEAAIVGVVMIVGGVVALRFAWLAAQHNAYIPYKSGSMYPTQAYIGGGLELILGLYLLIMWLMHRRAK